METKLNTKQHKTQICVIGGGIGGMFTAISAARHGARVVLMQDRPVLGGNCSSEIRMWISGAGTRVRDLQETGIMEELLLENMHRNPRRNFTAWDALLYEMVKNEKNIKLLLNCTCCDADMDGDRIARIRGFQLTTYTWHEVEADIFVDSSGDSILAPLTGAEYKVGREAKSEYNEEFGLETADRHTMGMSVLLQCREMDHPVSYTPPAWAYSFPDDDAMNNKPHDLYAINTNFYWIELGGMQDSIADTEEVRDELLKIAFGVWDHIKNHGDHGAENWDLEWVGFLPGKRESRRYVGDYVMTQQDVETCPRFPDTVAYGGWQIDNHLPGGFRMDAKGGAHLQKRRLSEPYPIPFRSLYSKNIENLMFAGRNISATHMALSSTRVMATCAVMGQAAGTGAAVALRHGCLPAEVTARHMAELQQLLLEDGCFIPGHLRRQTGRVTAEVSQADRAILENGWERPHGAEVNCVVLPGGGSLTLTLHGPVSALRLALDPDFSRESISSDSRYQKFAMRTHVDWPEARVSMPARLLKSCTVTAGDTVFRVENNRRALLWIPLPAGARQAVLSDLTAWGGGGVGLFGVDAAREAIHG